MPRDVLEDMAEVLDIPAPRELGISVLIDKLMEAGSKRRWRTPQEEGEALVSVGVSPGASGSGGVPAPGTPSSVASSASTKRRMRVLPALGVKTNAEMIFFYVTTMCLRTETRS